LRSSAPPRRRGFDRGERIDRRRAPWTTTSSSKLTSIGTWATAHLADLRLDVFNKTTGWYFDLRSINPNLDDRRINARGGQFGTWRLSADWTGIPHNYSNKAQTPYALTGPGQLEVAGNVPITFRKLTAGRRARAGGDLLPLTRPRTSADAARDRHRHG
jgi:hypothetical protein